MMIIETGGKRQFCPLQLSSEQQWTFLFTGFLASTKKISFDKYVWDLSILPYPLHIFRRHCNADRIVRWSILWPAIPIEKDFRVFEKIQRGLKLEKLSFNSICAILFSNIEKKLKKCSFETLACVRFSRLLPTIFVKVFALKTCVARSLKVLQKRQKHDTKRS